MTLYCPRCEAAAAGTLCPRCGGRLIAPGEAAAVAFDPTHADYRPVAPTAAGRVAVGAVAALGLGFALRDWLFAAGALVAPARGLAPDAWRGGAEGEAATAACAVAAAGAGGLLAGAGRPSGVPTGLAVAAACVAVLLGPGLAAGRPMSTPDAAVAAVVTVAAVAAACVGARVWPALADLPAAPSVRASALASSVGLAQVVAADEGDGAEESPGVVWWRVLVAGAVAAAALVAAAQMREGLRDAFGPRLRLGNAAHVPEVALQLAAFPVALAGVLAGASTRSGLRHGALAGVLATLLLVAHSAARGAPAALEGWLALWELPPTPFAPRSFAATAGGLVLFLAACGEVGSQLLWPPGAGRRSRVTPV